MNEKKTPTWLRILALIAVIAVIVLLLVFRSELQKLQKFGYAGVFLLSIAANATIIIPIPGVAVTTAMGAVFNPIGVAIAAGLGASLGELSGYLTGFSGQGIIERHDNYLRVLTWMREHPRWIFFIILLMAFIPNPLMDVAGMVSGALKIPVWKFLLPCAIGKIMKMFLFAYAGHFSWSIIT
jgi:membrane protein YqaA with SNARE-associated domain